MLTVGVASQVNALTRAKGRGRVAGHAVAVSGCNEARERRLGVDALQTKLVVACCDVGECCAEVAIGIGLGVNVLKPHTAARHAVHGDVGQADGPRCGRRAGETQAMADGRIVDVEVVCDKARRLTAPA